MSEKKIEGLGDVVAAVTDTLGIKKCDACKKRQSWLNDKTKNMWPFNRGDKVPDRKKHDEKYPDHIFTDRD
jgi:hypothetical protein